MRAIEKTVFLFDELSDAAKEKAREWFRGGIADDNWWSESVIDHAKHVGALIGFEVDRVYWRGFWSQGDGACWAGSVTYYRGRPSDVARECPQDAEIQRIARAWLDLQRQNSNQVRGRVSANDRYMRTSVSAYWADDREEDDDDDGRIAYVEDDANQIASDFADWIYRSLEKEYDYQMSDECVDETIRANEYEFDEDGKPA